MERCERCGGKLYALWSKAGQTLPLCGTHNREHRKALIAQGWLVRLFAQV